MPYRESADASAPLQRVELLRIGSTTTTLAPQLAVGALVLVACAAFSHCGRGPAVSWADALLVVGVAAAWYVRKASLEDAQVVVSLERTEAGRAVLIERTLGSVVRRQRIETEELVTLSTETSDASSLSAETAALTVRLHAGTSEPIELYTASGDEATKRVRAAVEGFEQRAARVPTARELRKLTAANAKTPDKNQRELNDRYRAWFDEAIAADNPEVLGDVLDRGFSMDHSIDADGSTALDVATRRGAARCVRLLVERADRALAQRAALSAGAAEAEAVEATRVRVDPSVDSRGSDVVAEETVAWSARAEAAAAKK